MLASKIFVLYEVSLGLIKLW